MTKLLAPAHVDVQTSRDRQGAVARPRADACGSSCVRRAFSLIEVLLAIFILGVGVISIAALFPAGIAQQRASVDDIIAPTVANNAISLLRTKLRADDFGTFEQFSPLGGIVRSPRRTIVGDFTWLRPAFIFDDDLGTTNIDENGAIDIFSGLQGSVGAADYSTEFPAGYTDLNPPGNASNPTLYGIPYNRAYNGSGAPRILISQKERYYPAVSEIGGTDVARPQYVWDCMFRKFQGKVYVAIFVYRVTQPGGGNAAYVVARIGDTPPVPIAIDVTSHPSCANGAWHPGGPDDDVDTLVDDSGTPGVNESNTVILGMPAGSFYNPDIPESSWQEPRQWLLDQNNNIHRVLGAEMVDDDNDTLLDVDAEVDLVRAAPAMANLGPNNVFSIDPGTGDVVSDIWYMPVALRDVDNNLLTVTPVYCTVKEL